MSTRFKTTAMAAAAVVVLAAPAVPAQAQFEVVSQATIGEVRDLRIVSLRDVQRAQCYTLFIVETRLPEGEAAPSSLNSDAAESVQRLREAAARRDRDLAALRAPRTRWDSVVDAVDAARYEHERRKIDEAYETAIRAEIPGSSPWASTTPGVRSGGWDDTATAFRRAIVDPDPSSAIKTLGDQFTVLEDLLRWSIEAPRVAVAGPVACLPQ